MGIKGLRAPTGLPNRAERRRMKSRKAGRPLGAPKQGATQCVVTHGDEVRVLRPRTLKELTIDLRLAAGVTVEEQPERREPG